MEVPEYQEAAKYWADVPATVDGVLGGFGFVSNVDIAGSREFLKILFKRKRPPGRERALDCGAGIGRISKELLLPHFRKVDLVEQNAAFLREATNYVGRDNLKLGTLYNTGLQDFCPEAESYDVIWVQWVLGYLTDEDFVQFFRRCSRGLRADGVIVVKENVASGEAPDFDATDSSVTRPQRLLQDLFRLANLRCIAERRQANFPTSVYAVKMFALRPQQQQQQQQQL